jgi:hypothetical protein
MDMKKCRTLRTRHIPRGMKFSETGVNIEIAYVFFSKLERECVCMCVYVEAPNHEAAEYLYIFVAEPRKRTHTSKMNHVFRARSQKEGHRPESS